MWNDRESLAAADARGFYRLCALALRTCTAVACIGFACVAPTALPAPELPAMLIGVGTHDRGDAARLRAIGALTRITHYAGDDSAVFAERVHELQRAGLAVVVVMHSFARDTVAEVAALVRAFPGVIWQVLNEAETRLTGAQYADLMRRIVAAAPAAHFVGMGLGTVNRFTAEYLAANGPALDAWCVHVYGLSLAPSVSARVAAIREQLGSRMPIWITEIGVDRAAIDSAWRQPWTARQIDSLQARELANGLRVARDLGVSRAIVYQLRDGGDTGFGLLRNDGSERPAMAAVREFGQ